MKRIFLFLVVALCFLSVRAQQTSLVIDNQTPGWLSSKIGYGDQKTIHNLKITGYINAEDLKFIGEMICKQALRGCIDLENVNIVGKTTDEDNVMPENSFKINWSSEYPDGINISHIKLPLSITNSMNCLSNYLFVDTVTIGSKSMPTIKAGDLYDNIYSGGDGISLNKRIKHLTLREGVTEISERAFYNKPYNSYGTPKEECRFESVSIPTTVKKVGGMAFHCCYSLKDCLLPDNIEIIESDAFTKTSFVPDTLDLPLNLRTFYTNSFTHKANQVIIIKENVEEFNNRNWYITKSTNLTFVMHCITPPVFQKGEKDDWYSPSYSDGKDLSGCTIYVPKESFGKYSDPTYDSVGGPAGHWSGWVNPYSYAKLQTIYVPATSINLNYTEFNLEGIGSTVQLEAIVLPDDATNKEVNWKSSNENVCIVSNGTVVAVNSGTSVIIATTIDGGYMAVCTIFVQADTGIADIKDSNVNYEVYSLYGQRQNALQRGVNIVVFEDGTKAKVFVK